MELVTDEYFFTEEWFIENITCWNCKIHGKAIMHKNVIVDQLNFRLELYPNGENGYEENLVVGVYDENRSNGELSFISSDGSLLSKLEVKDIDWNECYVILPTEIKFEDVVKQMAQKPFHVDSLTLRYQKRKSFDVIFRVRNKIDVVDTLIEIPTSQLDGLPWTDKRQSILNFLIDGKLATFQFIASTVGSNSRLINFEFMLMNMVKNSSSQNYFLMRSCIYLLNGEGDLLAFEENEHVFLNLRNWNFTYLGSGDVLEKGLSLLIRLKFVTGSKQDNYTSCWFQPQQLNITKSEDKRLSQNAPFTNGLATFNPHDFSGANSSENTPQAMHQFTPTKASESVPGEIFTQSDVLTDQVDEAAKSVPTDFSTENFSESTNYPNTAKTDQEFYIKKGSESFSGELFTQSDVVTDQVDEAAKSVPTDFSTENFSESTNYPNTAKTDQEFYIKKGSESFSGEVLTQSDVTERIGVAESVPSDFSKENSTENTNDPTTPKTEQQFNITKPVAPSGDNFPPSVKDDTTDQLGCVTSVLNDFSEVGNSSENASDHNTPKTEQQVEITKSDVLSGKNSTQSATDAFTNQVEHAFVHGDFSPENSPENTNDLKDTLVEQKFNHTQPAALSGANFPQTVRVISNQSEYTISESEVSESVSEHCSLYYWPEKFYEKSTEDSVTALKMLLELFSKEFSEIMPFADFNLSCGNTTFLVHREVMACRSQVFRSLLSSESDSMDLPDLDLRACCHFLFYLYSFEVEGMPWEVALKLYRAAEKYQVPALKNECSTILSANVSVSNVCEILLLADQYHDEMLSQVVNEFILSNYNEVLSSKEWKCLKDSEGHLICKTLSNLADKVMLEKSKCFADFE